jgi:hypothetical protein
MFQLYPIPDEKNDVPDLGGLRRTGCGGQRGHESGQQNEDEELEQQVSFHWCVSGE